MKCEDVNELLIPYLDGELSKEEREAIELHLSTCSRCREELEALAAIRDGSRQALKAMAAEATSPAQSWEAIEPQLISEQPKIAVFSVAKSKMRGGNSATPGAITGGIGG
jgi:anti-sigma factor RsiW